MKSTFSLLILLCSCICMVSCKYDSIEKRKPDVYISGNGPRNPRTIAGYWKNGSPVHLTDGSVYSIANGINSVDNDVYVVGAIKSNLGLAAYYWKNGVAVHLLDSSLYAEAKCIAVSGNDVYIGGYLYSSYYGHNIAVYWKNGILKLLSNGAVDGVVNSIFISGSDVYIAGFSDQGATYWKNEVPQKTYDGCGLNAIAVSGNDVYVVGYRFVYNNFSGQFTGSATYWKNGTEIDLYNDNANSSLDSQAKAITIDGSDVYIAGYHTEGAGVITSGGTFGTFSTVAKYWKNGVAVSLTDGTQNAQALGIAVDGSDIHVIGVENYAAKYWKNGISMKLSATDSSKVSLTSICLSK